MHNTKSCYSGLAVSFAFLSGAVACALAEILLTTKSGQEVRWDVEDNVREKQQYLLRKAQLERLGPGAGESLDVVVNLIHFMGGTNAKNTRDRR